MRSRLRIAARVIAGLLIPFAVFGLVSLGDIPNPSASVYGAGTSDDEDERALEEEFERCRRVEAAHPLVRVIASEGLGHAAAACAELRASVAPARVRLEANSVARAGAFADFTRQVIDGQMFLGVFLLLLALGGLLAALGLGRVAAGLLVLPCAYAAVVGLLPIALGTCLPLVALFLGCAPYGEGPRTPSDERAALVISLAFVPVVSATHARRSPGHLGADPSDISGVLWGDEGSLRTANPCLVA